MRGRQEGQQAGRKAPAEPQSHCIGQPAAPQAGQELAVDSDNAPAPCPVQARPPAAPSSVSPLAAEENSAADSVVRMVPPRRAMALQAGGGGIQQLISAWLRMRQCSRAACCPLQQQFRCRSSCCLLSSPLKRQPRAGGGLVEQGGHDGALQVQRRAAACGKQLRSAAVHQRRTRQPRSQATSTDVVPMSSPLRDGRAVAAAAVSKARSPTA